MKCLRGSARRTLRQMAGQINASNRFYIRDKSDLVNQRRKIRQGNESECIITQLIRTLTVVPIN